MHARNLLHVLCIVLTSYLFPDHVLFLFNISKKFPPHQDFDVQHDYLMASDGEPQVRIRKRGQNGTFSVMYIYIYIYIHIYIYIFIKFMKIHDENTKESHCLYM